MSKLKWFPAVLLFLAGVVLPAQQLETKPADPAAAFRDEAYVVEQLQTVVRFENDGSERREQTARVRVQSDAGVQRLSQLVFGYSSANEQMEMAYVRVRRPDGSVMEASAADMQDLPSPVAREAPVYSDFREKHITVPGLQPGQELEYSIVVRTEKPLLPNHFWMEYSFEKQTILLDEQLEINLPREREIKLKTQPGFEPEISDQGDRRIYRWESSNLQRESDADKKKKLKTPKPELPDIELSTLRSWDEVGRWYWDLQKDRITPTAAVRAKAAELVRDKKTDTGEDRRALRLCRHQLPLRQPVLRAGTLPAAPGGGNPGQPLRRLQRQAHPAGVAAAVGGALGVSGAHQQQPRHRSRRARALAVRPRDHRGPAERRIPLDGHHDRGRALPAAGDFPAQQKGAGDSRRPSRQPGADARRSALP